MTGSRPRRVALALLAGIVLALLAPGAAAAASPFVTSYDRPASWSETANAGWPDSRYAGEFVASYSWYSDDSSYAGIATPFDIDEAFVRAYLRDSGCTDCTLPLYRAATLAEFATASNLGGADASAPEKTTLGGLDGYLRTRVTTIDEKHRCSVTSEVWYWLPTAAGAITVYSQASAFHGYSADAPSSQPAVDGCGALQGRHEDLAAQARQVLTTMRFAVPGAEPAPAAGSDTWKTVVGGLAAVAAAAAALAAAGGAGSGAGSSGRRDDSTQPPNTPIGYVLQLSTAQVRLAGREPGSLVVRTFAAFRDGSFRAAPDIGVTLAAPPGVQLSHPAGAGMVTTSITSAGPVPPGGAIHVQATSSLGATTATVPVVLDSESTILTRFAPERESGLATTGDDSLVLAAGVELGAADLAAGVTPEQVADTIAFETGSPWLDLSTPTPWELERAVRVVASQPDPTSPVSPPEFASVQVSAQIGERRLTADVAVPLAPLPVLDARPDQVDFAAGSGARAEVAVWVEAPGALDWELTTEWLDGSPVVAVPDLVPDGPARARLTLTESASDVAAGSGPFITGTLVVVATADALEPLRRHIAVVVAREGLFVRTAGTDPSTGAFWVAADGSAHPTEVDLMAFVADPSSGEVHADADLAAQATVEIGGEEGSAGEVGLRAVGLAIDAVGIRPLEPPSAIFRLVISAPLPTGPDPLAAALTASIPGRDDAFTVAVPLRLRGVDTEPFSDAWRTELDRCQRIIDEFVPAEHRTRLTQLLHERATTLGAEGLYVMRTRLWGFARDQLVKEAHDYLDQAWWYEQVENTLEWVSWCGDIALGVLSGGSGALAMGTTGVAMLKPFLVEAVQTWVNGGSVEDWVRGQGTTLLATIEGVLTDPDLLAHLSGRNRAVGYVLFVSYYFVKELEAGRSVADAMRVVAGRIRDDLLVRFLRGVAFGGGHHPTEPTRHGDADPAAPKATAPEAPTPKPASDAPPAPGAPRPGEPDQPRAAQPDAPVADAPASDHTPSDASAPDTAAPDASAPRPPADEGPGPARPDDGARTTADQAPHRPEPSDPAHQPATDAPEQHPGAEPDQPPSRPNPDEGRADDTTPRQPGDTAEPGRRGRTDWPEGDPAARARAMAAELEQQSARGHWADSDTVDSIMRDPDAMRMLKKEHPQAWEQFHTVRQEIYRRHDGELTRWIEDNVPQAQGRTVEVRTVGTPDGVDRDYRAGYVVDDPATGQRRFIELPRTTWAEQSMRIFAENTGGPTDPARAHAWAKDRQQLPTDHTHAEASVDMADQATIWDPKTETWERTQQTPNLHWVEQGRSTLLDPEGLGNTYRTKVAESYHPGHHLDAYRQASKSVDTLDACRRGYAQQHYSVTDVPAKVRSGMDAIRDVEAGRLTPEAADARLRELHYEGGLPDFMEAISGQFASFKFARKG